MDSYRQFKQTNRPTDMSISVSNERRRRGRPCALERQNNDLLQAQLSSMISQSQFDFDSDFAKLNILPFINRRQRRARANDRERCRMQTLNEALDVLKSMLPIDYLLTEEVESDGQRKGQCQSPKLTKIDTLKLATKYIRILTELLNDNVCGASGNVDSSPVWSCSNTVTDSSSVESLSPSLAPFVPTYSANYVYASSSSLYFYEPTKYTSYATLQSEQHQLISQSQPNSTSNPIY